MYVIKLFLLSRATSRIEDCHYGFASNLKRCCTRRRFLLDSWWRDIRDQVNGYDRCNQHTFWYRRGGMWVMFVIQYIHEEVREKGSWSTHALWCLCTSLFGTPNAQWRDCGNFHFNNLRWKRWSLILSYTAEIRLLQIEAWWTDMVVVGHITKYDPHWGRLKDLILGPAVLDMVQDIQ